MWADSGEQGPVAGLCMQTGGRGGGFARALCTQQEPGTRAACPQGGPGPAQLVPVLSQSRDGQSRELSASGLSAGTWTSGSGAGAHSLKLSLELSLQNMADPGNLRLRNRSLTRNEN